MDKGEREIVTLMTEWQSKITQITIDYTTAIGKLDAVRNELETIRSEVEKSKKKFWVLYRPFLITITTIVILVISFIALSKWTKWCSISLSIPPKISASNCTK